MADDQVVTHGFLKGVMRGMGEMMREKVLAPSNTRIAELETRTQLLEADLKALEALLAEMERRL